MRRLLLFLMSFSTIFQLSCKSRETIPLWGMFQGEIESAKNYTDPFREIDLLLEIKRPDKTTFGHFGFYNGENTWKFRIMPDMEGTWHFTAKLSDCSKAISGEFICRNTGKTGPVIVHPENPIWYSFRNSKSIQIRSFHTGDRFFASNFNNTEREKFLNWIEESGYNMLSVASHYLNRQQPGRGEGWDTPALWPLNPEEFDKMESILMNLEKRNIYVHPFAGFFGRAAEWPTDHAEQELYIRYTLARLAPFRNIILNIGGPEPLLKPEQYQNRNMTREDIRRVAKLIKKYDPYAHMLSVHNRTSNENKEYGHDFFIFEEWEDYSTLQGGKSTDLQDVYNFILESRMVIKPVYAHEVMWYGNMYHEELDPESLRKKAIILLMAGSFINFGDMNGNSSSGFSGCLDPDSSNIEAHETIHNVWDFFDQIPFTELSPSQDLIENAFCLSDGKSKHLVYSPEGDTFSVNFSLPVSGKWINPRNREEWIVSLAEKTIIPPDKNDWFLWIIDDQ